MDQITALATITQRVGARVALVGALALLTACQPTEPSVCSGEVPPPPFTVTVRAADGPLPTDTLLTLAYGAGMEEFALEAPPIDPMVMFCEPKGTSGAAGAAGAGGEAATTTEALVCNLYVEGAATLWVTGGDYPELVEELQGEANECGPENVEAELVLGEVSTDSSDE